MVPMQTAPARQTRASAVQSNIPAPPLTIAVPEDTPRFSDLAKQNLIHPVMLQTITQDMHFDHMMPVQAATLQPLLADRADVLAQAKTGTGKTVAFLLPAIQTLINSNRPPGRGTGISLLVISPTRELAMQIAKEATQLLQRLPQYRISVAIGGTNKDREEREILGGCDILIATPGRLYDHLSNRQIVNAFRHLDTLVLDEADRLLDMGFMNALQDIIRCLPDKLATKRQGMLFSATIAPHVTKVAHLVLSPGYQFISTIPKGESNTHERVPQHLITVPTFSHVAPALVGAIRAESVTVGPQSFKAIIFAPTAALADFYGYVLQSLPNMPKVSILHSRVNQTKRTKITGEFRDATQGIIVATDVIARGMDFPGVSTVFQVGVPADRESYIHRLGRTARAGAEGRGIFIVTQVESFFPQKVLAAIKFINETPDLSAAQDVFRAAQRMDEAQQAKIYQAWLGYYKNHANRLQWTSEQLVAEGNVFAREGLGSPGTPALKKTTVGKMGLKGVKGLVYC